MIIPTSPEELRQLVEEGVEESLHLDYKRSLALSKDSKAKDEVAKDVSAFANSDGGVIVYGVAEVDGRPHSLDEGADQQGISKEWLENVIRSRISPPLNDLRIYPIPAGKDRFYYVVHAPKSYRGPHQSLADKRYYRRYNFCSVPMEDYELADLRTRSRQVQPLVAFRLSKYERFLACFDIENLADIPAHQVSFTFTPDPCWPDNEIPAIIKNGAIVISPGQRFRIRYHPFSSILNSESSLPRTLICRIGYFHPILGSRVSDEWQIDFEAYRDTMHFRSDLEVQLEQGVKTLGKIANTLERLHGTLRGFETLRGATGLDVSLGTLKQLTRLLAGQGITPIDPRWSPHTVFMELLGVDLSLADRLERVCRTERLTEDMIRSVEGMTPDLLARFKEAFRIEDGQVETGAV